MRDWARVSVERQIKGMRCDKYEIGVRDAHSGRMMNHEWTGDQLAAKVPWLKAMNARGNDIYIRPAAAGDLVLIDDLTAGALERLKADGLAAAVAVETSPGNFQAWIRIPGSIDDQVKAEASRILAQRYGGDPASTGRTHYGRLSGFTNRKPQHSDESGRGPFCRLDSYAGAAGPAAAALVTEAEASIADRAAAAERERRVAAIHADTGTGKDLVSEYRRRAAVVMQKYDEPDLSRVDFMVARDMIRAGRPPEAIAVAITEASPEVTDRKAGHVDDYATRTTAAAVKAVESERQASQGMGR